VLDIRDLPWSAVEALGNSSSQRINSMVTDVVTETLAGQLTEIRMSEPVLQATLDMREFLFQAVYENPRATAEFEKAVGVLGGLWERLRARPDQYLDAVTVETEGLDAAARDFLAGMTDRYAVALFEDFYVPRSWSG
jgi:dGTPase